MPSTVPSPAAKSPSRRLAGCACALLCAAVAGAATAQNAPEPLSDVIAEAIPKGDIVVAAKPFLRAPRTMDTAKPVGTNDAHARLQYMKPIPDGSGRLAFIDVRGVLYVADADGGQASVYLDLRTGDTGFYNSAFPNESGLLGFAFHPDFAREGAPGYGKLYAAYSAEPADTSANVPAAARPLVTYLSGRQESVIREWTATDISADVFAGDYREILRVDQFAATHNVGTIAFNPFAARGDADYGMLYACFGDGGGANDPHENGQNPATLLASIIRIDPLPGGKAPPADAERAYGIPPDNPFVGRADAAPEVWAYGLRHPQHFSWAPDGRMFISDIGQDQVEEVNIGVAGGNYGWRLREGNFATAYGVGAPAIGQVYARPSQEPDFVYPVAQYDRSDGYAIGSGYAYRGSAIAELRGKYVFADITVGRVFYIDTDGLQPGRPAPIRELRITFDGAERPLLEVAGFKNTYHGGLRADLRLGIDADGELYMLTKGDGWIRKLVPATP